MPGEAAPASLTAADSCSASRSSRPDFLVPPDQREVGPLSGGVTSRPLSARLPGGLRFLPPPLPPAPSAGLAAGFPGGEATGWPRSADVPAWVRPRLDAGGTTSAPGEFGAPGLATYLLVQACQHLWLVLGDDACSGSPGLTIPRAPGPQPPWCWQSQLGLTPPLPSRRMRVRCAEGSALPRCQGRTPR